MAKHENYTKADFTREEIDRENIIAKYVFQGLAICKRCGAAESEQDKYPTCEEFRSYLSAQDRVSDEVKRAMPMIGSKKSPVVVVVHGDPGNRDTERARRAVIEDVYRRGGPGAGAGKYRS